MDIRVGLGHDSHRLTGDRRLVLGGVEIPHDCGLLGHSDADVLLHAVTDALLGAAGLGDIGERFPNTDGALAGADSALFVREAVRLLHEAGWKVANLDCTLFAEEPKLSPYKQQIRRRISELLDVPLDAVNVKAKTGEQVGPIGRKEAMSADAIVLITRE